MLANTMNTRGVWDFGKREMSFNARCTFCPGLNLLLFHSRDVRSQDLLKRQVTVMCLELTPLVTSDETIDVISNDYTGIHGLLNRNVRKMVFSERRFFYPDGLYLLHILCYVLYFVCV